MEVASLVLHKEIKVLVQLSRVRGSLSCFLADGICCPLASGLKLKLLLLVPQ